MRNLIDVRTPVRQAANSPMLRDCTEIRQCILGQQQILIAAARDLQADYERQRDKSGFRWQELILVIKTPGTLMIEWSRRRRIRKTAAGRRWWCLLSALRLPWASPALPSISCAQCDGIAAAGNSGSCARIQRGGRRAG